MAKVRSWSTFSSPRTITCANGPRLAPAEALLDALPGAHAHGVALVASRAPVDSTAAKPVVVRRNMRRDVESAACLHEPLAIVFLVSRHRLALRLAGHLTIGHAVGLAGAHIDHQAATARACSARSDWSTSCRRATRCARSASG